MSIRDLKAWELREKLLDKEISSRQIVEEYLQKIEESDDELNAFITLNKEKALNDADKIDKKIKNGEDLGVLAGLPIAIKDNIITEDFRTTAGSKMLENFEPPYDATVIQRIKDSDGIIIGKTNMDEFAIGSSTENSFFGVTKNPLDHTKIAGGSSGGSAAAVAANQAPLALGSDTGGSIRVPASYCNIVGFKPSYGFISRYGLIALSDSLDTIGVFSKDVKDAVLMTNAISGQDKLDSTSTDMNTFLDIESIENNISLENMKIGLPREIYAADMDTDVRKEIEKAIKLFKDNGALVEEVSLASIKYGPETYRTIIYGDISSNLARFDGIQYGYRADDYNTLDELYIKSRTESLSEKVKKRILLGTYLLSGDNGEKYYKKAQKIRTLIIDDFNKIFSRYDVILSPASMNLPWDLTDNSKKYKEYNEAVNLAGLCSISIPTNNKFVGLQIIGDRFKESKIIKAALSYEGMVR